MNGDSRLRAGPHPSALWAATFPKGEGLSDGNGKKILCSWRAGLDLRKIHGIIKFGK